MFSLATGTARAGLCLVHHHRPYSAASGAGDGARLAGGAAMRGVPAPGELTDATTRTKYWEINSFYSFRFLLTPTEQFDEHHGYRASITLGRGTLRCSPGVPFLHRSERGRLTVLL